MARNISAADRSGTTLEDYRGRLRRDVIPQIGQRPLHQLTLADVQGSYAALVQRGLSARTVRYTHSVLRDALNKAVTLGLLHRNPAEHVDLPRQVRREMTSLTAQQANRFLVTTGDDSLHALWSVLLLGGLRPGEALGLKWSDVNGNKLRVNRALKKGAGDKYYLGAPKTASSRRYVLVSENVLSALQKHRERQRSVLEARVADGSDMLVFTNSVGHPMDIAKVRRLFKRALSAAGLPSIRLYDTRHTHASLLLGAGEHIKVVSDRLGHQSIEMTLSTYAHVLPDMQEASVGRLDRFLAEAAA